MINKALVINDDAITRMVACKMISKAEFANETVIACDGQAGLSYFDGCLKAGNTGMSELPEFIFLDLNMPVMDGWDFLEVFSKQYAVHFPSVKIAIMSSFVNDADKQKLQQYGMVLDCIAAPMNLGALSAIKEKFIRSRSVAA